MSFSLPANPVLPTSPERHNLAIAEVAIFGAVLPVQFCVRYIQIRHRGQTQGGKNPLSSFFRAALNFLVAFALIRIVGFSLYLAVENPSRSLLIAEVILQSIGLSPLLIELIFTVLWCIGMGREDTLPPSYPILKRLLQCMRFPIIAAVILFMVAGCILNLTCIKVGAIILMVTFVYLVIIVKYILFRILHQLERAAQRGLWFVVATLPLYLIRVIYLLLVEFGSIKFDPLIGDWQYLVGMGFAMEVGIVVLLVMARIAIEPLAFGSKAARVPPYESGKVETG